MSLILVLSKSDWINDRLTVLTIKSIGSIWFYEDINSIVELDEPIG